MIHLTEAIVGINKKPKQIGKNKRLCDLKPGDPIYIKFYSSKVAVGEVSKVKNEYIEYVVDGEEFDIYFPDYPNKPKHYILYPKAGSFEEDYYIDGNRDGYNIYTTSEELLKYKMAEYKK